MKRSSPPKRETPLARRRKPIARGEPPVRKTRPKPVNRKRKASAFKYSYGSKERVLFVKAMPCCVCGAIGSENAHIGGTQHGLSLKGPYTDIVPLDRKCHDYADAHPLQWQNAWWTWEAERVEAAWQEYLNWNVTP